MHIPHKFLEHFLFRVCAHTRTFFSRDSPQKSHARVVQEREDNDDELAEDDERTNDDVLLRRRFVLAVVSYYSL